LRRCKPSQLDPDALVFSTGKGTPLSRRNLLNRQFKPTCERLGLKGVTWHWLRHATATLSSSAGVPLGAVQVLLGHSSSQITREVYLEAVPSDVKNAVQIAEDFILGPKWTQVSDFPEPEISLIN
jgi:integrase